jgi:hypothetical protein
MPTAILAMAERVADWLAVELITDRAAMALT